jgi:hypothetical protein
MATRYMLTLSCRHRLRKISRSLSTPRFSKLFAICADGAFCRKCGVPRNGKRLVCEEFCDWIKITTTTVEMRQ